MKKFLKNASLFVFLLLLPFLVIEFRLLTIPNEYSYKREYVEKNGNSIKTLILGHSHAANGLAPKIMGDSIFNMAISGRSSYYDAVLAERYIPTLFNLECVVFPLGYNFVYSGNKYDVTMSNPSETINMGFTSTYRCMNSKYMRIDFDGDLPFQYWSEFLNSKFDYMARLNEKDFNNLCHCDSTGYQENPLKYRSEAWKTGHLPRIIDYDDPKFEKAWNWGVSNMKRIAAACRKAKVRFVVVTFPCYKTYFERTTERGMKDLYAVVDSMRTVYPDMEYYNYIDDKRFEEDDFFDASHLSEYGAKKFSRIFRDEVLDRK